MSVFYVWDIFPILALIALIVAFVVKRRAMKREEQELEETLASFAVKGQSNDDKQA